MAQQYTQIAVLSGKGGTGKTTVLASFAALAEDKVLVDCDVDAANLYLLLHPRAERKEDFWGAKIAVRDADKCRRCGECERRCRFRAITVDDIREANCEGCGLCVLACPNQALTLESIINGVFEVSGTDYGPMVHAKLKPAAENSGRLVSRVRQVAEDVALQQGKRLILIDGPPGIGCTVTATLVDVDVSVMVTEPSLSGMHDMERVVELAGHFDVPVAVVINKADINPENTGIIEAFCAERGIPVLAKLPFDDIVVQSNAQQVPLVEYTDRPVAAAVREAWSRLMDLVA